MRAVYPSLRLRQRCRRIKRPPSMGAHPTQAGFRIPGCQSASGFSRLPGFRRGPSRGSSLRHSSSRARNHGRRENYHSHDRRGASPCARDASSRSVLLVGGNDARGLVYALLELTDRLLYSDSLTAALEVKPAIVEQPHNRTRSMCRSFQSEVEDKTWFNDRSFWSEYLSMLAAERFNRFNLCLGLDYNSTPGGSPEVYLFFAYPFPDFVAGAQRGFRPEPVDGGAGCQLGDVEVHRPGVRPAGTRVPVGTLVACLRLRCRRQLSDRRIVEGQPCALLP